MEAELVRKGLWDLVLVEVDTDGKTDDNLKVKAELQKLVVKRSANVVLWHQDSITKEVIYGNKGAREVNVCLDESRQGHGALQTFVIVPYR